jgi:MmyB-like transcription regulator ligand binding domain
MERGRNISRAIVAPGVWASADVAWGLMFSNWRGRGVVAEFRASIGDRFGDPDLFRLSESLSRDSKNFKSFRGTRGVLEQEGGQRTFDHSIDGDRECYLSNARAYCYKID